jgi:tetratricopeptide (TPR) repeat protein
MTRAITLFALLTAVVATAQDLATYNKALSAYNSGSFEDSAKLFYDVYNTTTDNDLKLKAEYYLASSFQRKNLLFTAFVFYSPILKAGPAHPFHGKAVEALVTLQELLNDDYLIPSQLNNLYDKFAEAWATLPLEVLSRINYLIGRIAHRKGKLDESKQFLEAVPDTSQVYAKSLYLQGIALADPRFPATSDEEKRKHQEDAVVIFEKVLKIDPRAKMLDLAEIQQLANLGLGRVHYGLGNFDKAVKAYEKIPRFSKYWDQALFENGFARFQNDDYGGGLGSLQALYAPQFTGAFQPESYILTSTIYYFACLHEESKAALVEYENSYLPQAEALKKIVDGEGKDNAFYFQLVDANDAVKLPKPVLNWVRSNERMLGLFSMLKTIDQEKAAIDGVQSWKSAKLSAELISYLDQNRSTLEQVAGQTAKNRIQEAYRSIKGFADQAEIIRFEVAKAEKEFAESGSDQSLLLKRQTLYRPRMPAENWNYWKFQGEFWRDEIGYYQYTLKKGCPVGKN